MDLGENLELLRLYHSQVDAQQGIDHNKCIKKWLKKFASTPPPRLFPTKDNIVAEAHYSSAELKVHDNEYRAAVISYTKALQDAPAYSLIAALSYAGRSFALTKLELYEAALNDMLEALELPLPPRKKSECVALKDRIELRLRRKTYNEKKSVNNQPQEKENGESELVLAYGENEEIPGASSAITIAYDTKYGRKLVTTRPIKAGDVLIIERPYIMYPKREPVKNELATDESGWNCDHCLKNTMAPISCGNCFRLYCSKECRLTAYQEYHQSECLVVMPGDTNTAILRLLLVMTKQGAELENVKKCVTKIGQAKDSRERGFLGNQFRSDSYEAVMSLNNVGHTMVHINFDEVAMIATILRNQTNICRGNNDLVGLAKLVCYLHEVYASSSRSVRQYGTLDDVGEALYPLFTLINHSCSCNVVWYNYKNTFRVVRAAKDMKSGEQIFHNYLYPEGPAMKTVKRKELLSRLWGVECTCEACVRDYTFTPEIHYKLNVPASVKQRLKQNPIDVDAMWKFLHVIYKEINRPCFEIEIMKSALSMAYMGLKIDNLYQVYKSLGAL